MIYVTADIHNDYNRFISLLEKLNLSDTDMLYIIGDVFDRCDYDPKPLELYFELLKNEDNCKVIVGNHDILLADYIRNYYKVPEKKRTKLEQYSYNSFDLLRQRLTEVDMLNLADYIDNWPCQNEITVGNQKYLLAHAKAITPEITATKEQYACFSDDEFYKNGIDGYISICGHYNPSGSSVWENEKGNVLLIDCGAGYKSGRLACLRLDDKSIMYID